MYSEVKSRFKVNRFNIDIDSNPKISFSGNPELKPRQEQWWGGCILTPIQFTRSLMLEFEIMQVKSAGIVLSNHPFIYRKAQIFSC